MKSSRLGVVLALAVETMLFTGFLGAWIFSRRSGEAWPPEIMDSSWLMASFILVLAQALSLQGAAFTKKIPALSAAVFFSAAVPFFLGLRWNGLLQAGLGLSSGVFAAFFFWITGLYGLRALAALGWLLAALPSFKNPEGNFELAALYGSFGALLWAFLAVFFFML